MLQAAAFSALRHERFADLKAKLAAAAQRPAAGQEPLIPSALSAIDPLLGGGFPAGALVTLEGPLSSGRWGIAAALLANATHRGLGAVIDSGELYPPSLEAAGVRLERLLVVPATTSVSIARAVDLLLRSRIVRVVVMAEAALRAAVWVRLASLAHRTGALLVVVAARVWPELSANATVRLGLTCAKARMCGAHGPWKTFTGFDVCASVRKSKMRR